MTQCVELIPLVQSGPGVAAEMVNGVPVPLGYMVGLRTSGAPSPCTGLVLMDQAEYDALRLFTPQELGIDAAGILYVASWGIGVVLLLWSLGYAVGVGTRVIRKA